MTEPEPENTFKSELTAVVTAQVEHHPPCVPECPVCYPESEQ
jgi:hypothetical protein